MPASQPSSVVRRTSSYRSEAVAARDRSSPTGPPPRLIGRLADQRVEHVRARRIATRQARDRGIAAFRQHAAARGERRGDAHSQRRRIGINDLRHSHVGVHARPAAVLAVFDDAADHDLRARGGHNVIIHLSRWAPGPRPAQRHGPDGGQLTYIGGDVHRRSTQRPCACKASPPATHQGPASCLGTGRSAA